MTIAVLGSINIDVIAYADRLPGPGETVLGNACRLGLGGKGANQAVAARMLGNEVGLIGRVGADPFAKLAIDELSGYDLDVDHVAHDPDGATGVALIGVGQGGQNTIIVVAGSNMRLDASDVARSRSVLARARALLLQLEVPLAASLAAAATVRAAGGIAILDPAPAPPVPFDADVLSAVDVITPNETEAASLLGVRPTSPREGIEAAEALCSRGARAAVVKLAERGAAFADGSASGHVGPFDVRAIDTVAAGDCFNGGLAHALAQGQPLARAVRFASACGALSTTRQGAAASAPSLEEVEELLARA